MTGWRKRGAGVKPMNTTQTKVRSTAEALKLALEALKIATNYDPVIAKAITAIKEALSTDVQAQQSNEQGCEHCNHSLYCGTKCKNCGKQSNEQVEPVAWRSPNWGHSMDEWVYRDADDPVLTVDGKPSPSNEPLFAHPPVPNAKLTAQPKDPEQEPVAYLVYDHGAESQYLAFDDELGDMDGCEVTPLYTTPPQPSAIARKPLTDEQMLNAFNSCEKVIDGLHAVAELSAHGITASEAEDSQQRSKT